VNESEFRRQRELASQTAMTLDLCNLAHIWKDYFPRNTIPSCQASCADLAKGSKVFLDFPLCRVILTPVDNYVRGAGACSRFFFSSPTLSHRHGRRLALQPYTSARAHWYNSEATLSPVESTVARSDPCHPAKLFIPGSLKPFRINTCEKQPEKGPFCTVLVQHNSFRCNTYASVDSKAT
jgi:hypothetical protein